MNKQGELRDWGGWSWAVMQVGSDKAVPLFEQAAAKFQEVAALALLNWGNVHMCQARRLFESAAAEAKSAEVRPSHPHAARPVLRFQSRCWSLCRTRIRSLCQPEVQRCFRFRGEATTLQPPSGCLWCGWVGVVCDQRVDRRPSLFHGPCQNLDPVHLEKVKELTWQLFQSGILCSFTMLSWGPLVDEGRST